MRAAIILTGLVLAAVDAPWAGEPVRSFSDGMFVSATEPAIRIRINAAFEYLGNDEFVLGEIASVDRHYWVRSNQGEVEAMIVFQFEGFLEDAEGSYRFSIPSGDAIAGSNYRYSPERVTLGDHAYVHNTWAFDMRANAVENPGAESARALAFLARHGYRIDDALIMSRYVRAVGEDRRNEIILFYMEPLAAGGHTLDDFPDGGPRSDAFDRVSEAVTARGRRTFQVLDAAH